MNLSNRFKLSLIFSLLLPHMVFADDSQTDEYILKWAAFTGYNLSNEAPSAPISTLFNAPNTGLAQQYSLFTLFGAITVNAFDPSFSAFAPTESPYGKLFNNYANLTFNDYKSENSKSTISVSTLIDQSENAQNTPVNQFITNVLTTPNMSYCLNNEGTARKEDCPYRLYDSLVTYNVLGDSLPGPFDYFSYKYNKAIIPQLNSATLLSPLLYSTSNKEGSQSDSSTDSTNSGLTANNQLQEATNFIRYLSGVIVNPSEAVNLNDYNNAFTAANDTSASANPTNVINAQRSITNYLAGLRTYSAQMSVAMNNVYGMLSSRMPQKINGNTTTSSALSLFQLATRRVYDPSADANSQWVTQLNTASSATVNKEIAATLADILYMLYVLHQDNERQLLTASAGLMTAVRVPEFNKPDLSSDETADTSS